MTKLKAFADEKLNVAEMMTSLFDTIENNVVKGENAGYQHFLLFPRCFPKPSSDKNLNMGKKVDLIFHGEVNIVCKTDKAGYQHFLLYLQCFHCLC